MGGGGGLYAMKQLTDLKNYLITSECKLIKKINN